MGRSGQSSRRCNGRFATLLRRFAPIVLLLLATASEAGAVALKGSSRIEAVNRSGDLRWVWARNTSGEILAMDSNNNVGAGWINFGKPNGVSVNINGVAGTSWDTGAGWSQHVFYVGSDGNFYEGVKIGAGPVTWTGYTFVSGQTLTGHLAAGQVIADTSGTRMIAVVGTTTSGLLYRFTRNIGGTSASWTNSSGGRTWATDLPLASSVHPSQLGSLSFYGSMVSGTSTELGMVHYDSGGGWSVGARGNPGFPVCGSIAASEAQITSTTFRRYVVCTRADANSATIAFAYGTSDTDTVFDWITQTLPASVSTTRGNVVASTAQDVGGGLTSIDQYVMATDNHLYRQTRDSTGLNSPIDLGHIAEADWGFGGMSATSSIDTYSRVFYLARIDSSVGSDAYYLYERTGNNVILTFHEHQNYGAGNSLRPVVSSGPYAEGMIGEYGGTVSAAMIHRPGNSGPNGTDFPRVHAFRSDNDTHTMASAEILGNQVGGRTYNYVVDPTVAVTQNRRTYVLQLGVERSTCYGTNAATGAAVYLKRIDEGGTTYTTTPITSVQLGTPQTPTPIDHPAMDIEHGSGSSPDRLHMAWWQTIPPQQIQYAFLDDGLAPSSIVNLTGAAPNNVLGPPRVAANDLGDVYVYTHVSTSQNPPLWAIKVCKLNSQLAACDGGWSTVATDFAATDTRVNAGGQAQEIRTTTGYSLAASQRTAGVVHLCYQAEEANDNPACPGRRCKDIRCRRGAFTGGTFNWSAQEPVGPQNDGRDQFNPEVSLTYKTFTYQTSIATEGEVYVFWYDRNSDSQNRYYRIRVARSLNGGSSYTTRWLVSTDSDPADLPLHCSNANGNLFFIGDYSASKASILHTHALFVTTPGPVRTTDTSAAFRSLGSWWD